MDDDLTWERHGLDWPRRETSRFVVAGGLRWHVQCAGGGPAVLLVHGTGAATHSWRGLAPLLAAHCTLIAPDLPGHGFSSRPGRGGLSLPGMARALAELLRRLEISPVLAVGHSAGAAVIARMALDGAIAPAAVVGLNAALLPLDGAAGWFFSPAARLLSATPGVSRFFAWQARDASAVERLIRSTGSVLDAEGRRLYARLVGSPRHVAGALGMMAEWDLWSLARELPRLRPRLVLVVGGGDRTVPPAEAQRVRSLLPQTEVLTLPGLGHLAHEERPQEIAGVVLRLLAQYSGPV
jgi:magnesium chelatase accessory protein